MRNYAYAVIDGNQAPDQYHHDDTPEPKATAMNMTTTRHQWDRAALLVRFLLSSIPDPSMRADLLLCLLAEMLTGDPLRAVPARLAHFLASHSADRYSAALEDSKFKAIDPIAAAKQVREKIPPAELEATLSSWLVMHAYALPPEAALLLSQDPLRAFLLGALYIGTSEEEAE